MTVNPSDRDDDGRKRRRPRRRRSPVWAAIDELRERMENMASQSDVDALTAAVDQVQTDLATAQTNLQAEIDSLVSANPGVDVSALQAAIAPLDSAVQALGALKPTPPAPAGP